MTETPELTPDLRREALREGFNAERRVLYSQMAGDVHTLLRRFALEYDMAYVETLGIISLVHAQLERMSAEVGDG